MLFKARARSHGVVDAGFRRARSVPRKGQVKLT